MDFYRTVFKIALPIIMQNFLTSFVNMIDTVMVGQLGAVEIAAVGLGNQIFFVMNTVMFGVVSGGSIFMSQFWGKKRYKQAQTHNGHHRGTCIRRFNAVHCPCSFFSGKMSFRLHK